MFVLSTSERRQDDGAPLPCVECVEACCPEDEGNGRRRTADAEIERDADRFAGPYDDGVLESLIRRVSPFRVRGTRLYRWWSAATRQDTEGKAAAVQRVGNAVCGVAELPCFALPMGQLQGSVGPCLTVDGMKAVGPDDGGPAGRAA